MNRKRRSSADLQLARQAVAIRLCLARLHALTLLAIENDTRRVGAGR